MSAGLVADDPSELVAGTSGLPPSIASAVDILWRYALSHDAPYSSGATFDVILVCCSNDLRVAIRGAELWLAGAAPTLLFSGGVGVLTAGLFGGRSEAQAFADAAAAAGVPRAAMLVEGASTNTGENARFSAALLAEAGAAPPSRILLVQKPFMERRTLATFLKQWPLAAPAPPVFAVTSPQIALPAYAESARGLSLAEIIAVAVGDAQRIATYPRAGFQAYQRVPQEAWDAVKTLIRAGYTSHAIRRPGAPAGSRDPADYEALDSETPPPPPPEASDAER